MNINTTDIDLTKSNILFDDGSVGVLSWTELERLQGLPDGYTDMGSLNRIEKRGGVIGNGFNVDVVAHILNSLRNNFPSSLEAPRCSSGQFSVIGECGIGCTRFRPTLLTRDIDLPAIDLGC